MILYLMKNNRGVILLRFEGGTSSPIDLQPAGLGANADLIYNLFLINQLQNCTWTWQPLISMHFCFMKKWHFDNNCFCVPRRKNITRIRRDMSVGRWWQSSHCETNAEGATWLEWPNLDMLQDNFCHSILAKLCFTHDKHVTSFLNI